MWSGTCLILWTLSSVSKRPNRESVRVAWGAAEVHPLAYGLWNTPRALAHLRQPEAAARLMAFIAGYWTTHFGPLGRGPRSLSRLGGPRKNRPWVSSLTNC